MASMWIFLKFLVFWSPTWKNLPEMLEIQLRAPFLPSRGLSDGAGAFLTGAAF